MSGRIVVGVDGSPSSKAALAWAVKQAVLIDASVEAVIAWHYPIVVGGVPFAPIAVAETADFGELATKVLSDAIAETVDPDGPVKVSSVVREGNAAPSSSSGRRPAAKTASAPRHTRGGSRWTRR